MEHKTQIINEILATVDEYYRTTKKPVPLRILSARFARQLMKLGGFPSVIRALMNDRSIYIMIHYSKGSRSVYPHWAEIRKSKEEPFEGFLVQASGS